MMIRAALLGIALVSLLTAHPAAADTVTLRSEAYVSGPKVLLGDVATIDGPNAEFLRTVPLSSAALPGASKRINAALVQARLRGAGFDETEVAVHGDRAVLATTLHLELTRGMLAQSLRDYIQREMPWEPNAAIVEVVPPPNDYRVSDGDVDIVWQTNPGYAYLGAGTFRGAIQVDGRIEKTFYTRATVEAYDTVVVAASPIARGDRISRENVRLDKRNLSHLKAGTFFSLQDVAGTIAKSSIRAGDVVTERRIALPKLVKRNQIVAVETRIGSLSIRGRARTLSDGAAGDLLTCRNLASDEEFVGVLRADGVVQID